MILECPRKSPPRVCVCARARLAFRTLSDAGRAALLCCSVSLPVVPPCATMRANARFDRSCVSLSFSRSATIFEPAYASLRVVWRRTLKKRKGRSRKKGERGKGTIGEKRIKKHKKKTKYKREGIVVSSEGSELRNQVKRTRAPALFCPNAKK